MDDYQHITEEEWQAIPGWSGRYEVSNMGRVRALKRTQRTAAGKVMTWRSRMMKLTPNRAGRKAVTLSRPPAPGQKRRAARRSSAVAVLVLEAFVGPRPAGYHCCHNNGDCTDDRLVNLRWDTPAGNSADSVRLGRMNGPKLHISDADVRRMRCMYRRGASVAGLSELFGVSRRTATNITRARTRVAAGECPRSGGCECGEFP